ncbi:hypothetical protein BJX70DRAFT_396679 [Aspergillus crustosus]
MVRIRPDLGQKATVVLSHAQDTVHSFSASNRQKNVLTPGSQFQQYPEYHMHLNMAVKLIRDGAGEWLLCPDQLKFTYLRFTSCALQWTYEYLVQDLTKLSTDQIRALIVALDGFCIQIAWQDLRRQLPPHAVTCLGHIFGELLIHLFAYERLYENPFWYLDGKGPDGLEEDPGFAPKLNALFEYFHESNPIFGSLWKTQTQRLANPLITAKAGFGTYNAERREAALAGLAVDLMTSEPFCWLLKPLPASESEKRLQSLTNVIRDAVGLVLYCETRANGWAVLRGINELQGVYYVVARPGLVYVDAVSQNQPGVWNHTVTEAVSAEVVPVYVPDTDDAEGGHLLSPKVEPDDERKSDDAQGDGGGISRPKPKTRSQAKAEATARPNDNGKGRLRAKSKSRAKSMAKSKTKGKGRSKQVRAILSELDED